MYNSGVSSSVSDSTEPKPAPGSLRLVQAFINTHDMDYAIEGLDTPDSLMAWLRQAGLIEESVRVGARDLRTAIGLREALRVLLETNNSGETDPRTVRDLNRIAENLPLHICFDKAGQARLAEPATTVESALGNLLGVVLCAQAAGIWKRLKVCANIECKWVFYDSSKNRVGSWCRMSTCGNRAKSKAHRERQRKASHP